MYFANTWNKFHFVITPEEFRQLFDSESFDFVITNTRVEMDYQFSPKEPIFMAYQRFFDEIILRQDEPTAQERWNIEQHIHISLLDDYRKLNFEPFVAKNENGKMYKRVEPTEPVINISPLDLLFDKEKQKLSVAYMNREGVLGLMLSYPKTISKKSKNGNLYGNFSTENYKTATIYQELITAIKKLCKKAKISDGNKEYKPNFWISNNAKAVINQNIYLTQKGLTVL